MKDAELVLRAKGGDELSFRRLLKRCEGTIDWLTAKYFANGLEADDLAQAAMLGLHKAIESWRPSGGRAFNTYAGLLMERNVINLVRSMRRGRDRSLNEAASLDGPLGAEDNERLTLGSVVPDRNPANDPHSRLEHRATLKTLSDTFARLSELERDAVLGWADGKSYDEIASASLGALDCKSIDNAMQRGRKKLAAALEAANLDQVAA